MQISGSAAVMTDEEGTVSGDLDVRLDDSGRGLVRYRGTDTWLTIGNLDAEPAHTWDSVARLAAAIEAGIGARDAAGNTVPFEVFTEQDPTHANLVVANGSSTATEPPAADPATSSATGAAPAADADPAPAAPETPADSGAKSSAATGTPVADGGGDGTDQDGAHRPDQDQGEGPGERPAQG